MNKAEKTEAALKAVVAISMESFSKDKDLEVELAADWEDVGGVGSGMTKEQLEHVATTMFGCPVADEDE